MTVPSPSLGPLALAILQKRYLLRDRSGKTIEAPLDLLGRVSRAVAQADHEPAAAEKRFFEMLARQEFMPNSPTLMNAGVAGGVLPGCFVLPLEDSLESVFDTKRVMSRILVAGGGVGMSFGRLRPRGENTDGTNIAAGPRAFLESLSSDIEIFSAGRKRRGAAMGLLPVSHPDILDFVEAKHSLSERNKSVLAGIVSHLDSDTAILLERRLTENQVPNFNLSVAVTDDFMEALEQGAEVDLTSPRTMRVVERLPARRIWERVVFEAWSSGEPGVFFIDRANVSHPVGHLGQIEATNPCGEQPLLPYESCILGSLNVAMFMHAGGSSVDWDRLACGVDWAVRFLDDCIDVSAYPDYRVEAITLRNRKIGLGIMGFADLLIALGIAYDSAEGTDMGARLMAFVNARARQASGRLAEIRGVFPNYPGSLWSRQALPMRNACVTAIAPTGTISLFAGCSPGFEPLFALIFRRHVAGVESQEVNPAFERLARERGFMSSALLEQILANGGSCRGVAGVPADVGRVFATAFDLAPDWHVRMQAAFQASCDAAVSKTINLPADATLEAVDHAFRLAWRLGCKGITAFRSGSRLGQVLEVRSPERSETT